MAKEKMMEFVLSPIFVKIAKTVAEAIKDYPGKEDEVRWSVATAISKTEFGELTDIEYDKKKIVFKFKNGVNLVADL